ncbi:unnamed protein product [Cuscuta europaea]|uniref:Uncharacterized protein n=1 Tax=Cuscuta europaea TaxID=41803 RepID=A0A9P0ZUM3_CUSEU|nr:unnamed protein product [Cuscuta europaea]
MVVYFLRILTHPTLTPKTTDLKIKNRFHFSAAAAEESKSSSHPPFTAARHKPFLLSHPVRPDQMARSISNAKLVSAFISERVSVPLSRTYAAAAQATAGGVNVARSKVMLKRGTEESGKNATAWIPDPVTGYYRPESHVTEVDAVELRQVVLKNTAARQHY